MSSFDILKEIPGQARNDVESYSVRLPAEILKRVQNDAEGNAVRLPAEILKQVQNDVEGIPGGHRAGPRVRSRIHERH